MKREEVGMWPVRYAEEIHKQPRQNCLPNAKHEYHVTDVARIFEPPVVEHFCVNCGHVYYTQGEESR